MPLPNTRLIHPAFQRHHAPVAEGAMTAACLITRPATTPGNPTFDEVQGRSVYPDPPTVYVGACRIDSMSTSSSSQMVGDRSVTLHQYLVSLPVDTPEVQVYDLVKLTACDDDPTLVGHKLIVRGPAGGSLTFQRDLLCEAYPPTTR